MSFFLIRSRVVERLLRQLKEDTATGPDLLPSKVLKKCAETLALPISLIARLCIENCYWPKSWKYHWLHPIFKKKAVTNPTNYRRVHITSIVSKIVERAVGEGLVRFFLNLRVHLVLDSGHFKKIVHTLILLHY